MAKHERAYFERWRDVALDCLQWGKCWEMPDEYISSGDREGGVEVITIYEKNPEMILRQIVDLLG